MRGREGGREGGRAGGLWEMEGKDGVGLGGRSRMGKRGWRGGGGDIPYFNFVLLL